MLSPTETAALERCWQLAEIAATHGDIPVGAVLLSGSGQVLGEGLNLRELPPFDPVAHAEVMALRAGAATRCGLPLPLPPTCPLPTLQPNLDKVEGPTFLEKSGAGSGESRESRRGWSFEDCTLVVSLEPCTMCAGAIVQARVGRLIFGAWDEKAGACGSVRDVVRDRRLNHRVEVYGGMQAERFEAQLREFFTARRLC